MIYTLKPYTGNHAGNLHHVVKDGIVVRNATELEVMLWQERDALAVQVKDLRQGVEDAAVASCKTTACTIAERVLAMTTSDYAIHYRQDADHV